MTYLRTVFLYNCYFLPCEIFCKGFSFSIVHVLIVPVLVISKRNRPVSLRVNVEAVLCGHVLQTCAFLQNISILHLPEWFAGWTRTYIPCTERTLLGWMLQICRVVSYDSERLLIFEGSAAVWAFSCFCSCGERYVFPPLCAHDL